MDTTRESEDQYLLWNSQIQELLVTFILASVLYGIASYIINRFRRPSQIIFTVINNSTYADRVTISIVLACTGLAISIGSVLLAPVTMVCHDILLQFPNNYYLQWLSRHLIYTLWSRIFWAANVSLFSLLPFAYLYHEASGFGRNTKNTLWRTIEAFVVWLIFSTAVGGFLYFARSLYPVESIPSFGPFIYSFISLAGSVLVLWCTPGGIRTLGAKSIDLFRTYKVLVSSNRQELEFESQALKFKIQQLNDRKQRLKSQYSSSYSKSLTFGTSSHALPTIAVHRPSWTVESPIITSTNETSQNKEDEFPMRSLDDYLSDTQAPIRKALHHADTLQHLLIVHNDIDSVLSPNDIGDGTNAIAEDEEAPSKGNGVLDVNHLKHTSLTSSQDNLDIEDNDEVNSHTDEVDVHIDDIEDPSDHQSNLRTLGRTILASRAATSSPNRRDNIDGVNGSLKEHRYQVSKSSQRLFHSVVDNSHSYRRVPVSDSPDTYHYQPYFLDSTTNQFRSSPVMTATQFPTYAHARQLGHRNPSSHFSIDSNKIKENCEFLEQEILDGQIQSDLEATRNNLAKVNRELYKYRDLVDSVPLMSSIQWIFRNILAIILSTVNLITPALLFLRSARLQLRPYMTDLADKDVFFYYNFLAPDENTSASLSRTLYELFLVIYLTTAAFTGLYNSKFFTPFRPRKSKTSVHIVLLYVYITLVLASATPVVARILGLVSFDLMGAYDNMGYLKNSILTTSLQIVFEILLIIRYLEFFPWKSQIHSSFWRFWNWAANPVR